MNMKSIVSLGRFSRVAVCAGLLLVLSFGYAKAAPEAPAGENKPVNRFYVIRTKNASPTSWETADAYANIVKKWAQSHGVKSIELIGDMKRGVQIEVDPARMAVRGCTLKEIKKRLDSEIAAHTKMSGGNLKDTVEWFKKMTIASANGVSLRLGDIANIRVGSFSQGRAYVDGIPSVAVMVRYQPKKVDESSFPQKPDNVICEPFGGGGGKYRFAFLVQPVLSASEMDYMIRFLNLNLADLVEKALGQPVLRTFVIANIRFGMDNKPCVSPGRVVALVFFKQSPTDKQGEAIARAIREKGLPASYDLETDVGEVRFGCRDGSTLRQVAASAIGRWKSEDGLTWMNPVSRAMHVQLDAERMGRMGITSESVSLALEAASGGIDVGEMGGVPVRLVFSNNKNAVSSPVSPRTECVGLGKYRIIPSDERSGNGALETLSISSDSGARVPLHAITKLEMRMEPLFDKTDGKSYGTLLVSGKNVTESAKKHFEEKMAALAKETNCTIDVHWRKMRRVFRLSPPKRKGAPEKTSSVNPKATSRAVVPEPSNIATLASYVPARVLEVRVKAGDRVSKGETLVVLDAADFKKQLKVAETVLKFERANLNLAEASCIFNETEFKRMKKLLEKRVVSKEAFSKSRQAVEQSRQEVKAAKAKVASAEVAVEVAKRKIQKCTIKAPVGGVVVDVLCKKGSYVKPGEPLIRLTTVPKAE